MPKILISFAAAFCFTALIGCGDDEHIIIPLQPPETLSVSFQDGVSPNPSYGATRDAVIKNGPTNDFRNGNFGTLSLDTLGAVRLGSAFYDRRLVIKMDLSGITDCSTVLSASLSIRIIPPAPDSVAFEAHRVIRPDWNTWIEGSGGTFGGVSWTTVDGTAPWTLEGGDYDAAVLDQETASSDSTVTFSLSPRLVRDWIKQPATNHGVIIKGAETSRERSLVAFTRESDRTALRPRITVIYLKGG